jgi:hypothetical protein
MQFPASTVPAEVWLPINDGRSARELTFLNWDQPCLADIVVRKAWLVRET